MIIKLKQETRRVDARRDKSLKGRTRWNVLAVVNGETFLVWSFRLKATAELFLSRWDGVSSPYSIADQMHAEGIDLS